MHSTPPPPDIQILQWTEGSLSNAGEKLELAMPADYNESGILQYIRIDRLNYSDGAHPEDFDDLNDPWPTDADGLGESLERIYINRYGNDPNNWDANEPSPGRIPALPSDWHLLSFDDFEAGFGNYTDGGDDCMLYTGGAYAHQPYNAANIQDGTGNASSFYHTNGVDVETEGYTQIRVEFWYYPLDMETGESFKVSYFDGSNWQTIKNFVCGTDFYNDNFYYITLYIDKVSEPGKYNFPPNMKLKFTCDASSNTDDIYIDEISVMAK